MDMYIGIAVLVAIVGGRWFWGWWRMHRLQGWWNKGHAALQSNNLVAAEAAFRECTRLLPISSAGHRMLGGVLARRNKLQEAEEQLRFGAELEPRNPDGHMDLALFLALCVPNRFEEAAASFRTAIECAPQLREFLAKDPRFDSFRGNEHFRKLLETPES